MDAHRQTILRGAAYGLTAAVLFGLSVPLSKMLLHDVQPSVLSGLYYFGAGVGLFIWRAVANTVHPFCSTWSSLSALCLLGSSLMSV